MTGPSQGDVVLGENLPPRRYFSFYYHPGGPDTNGNGGPSVKDDGWRVFTARVDTPHSYNQALKTFPRRIREKIETIVAEYYREREETGTLEDFVGDTAMWGVGFTLMDESSWLNELRNEGYNDDAEGKGGPG